MLYNKNCLRHSKVNNCKLVTQNWKAFSSHGLYYDTVSIYTIHHQMTECWLMINWKWFGVTWSWCNHSIIWPFRKTMKNVKSWEAVPWPRFKPSTFSIHVYSITVKPTRSVEILIQILKYSLPQVTLISNLRRIHQKTVMALFQQMKWGTKQAAKILLQYVSSLRPTFVQVTFLHFILTQNPLSDCFHWFTNN
jgi:hypothetical protein